MPNTLVHTVAAQTQLSDLEAGDPKKHRRVLKTLGLMETNLRHPGLQTHEFTSLKGAGGEKVYEAYVENKTPGAFRVFWHYGPGKNVITVIAITPHP